ncbi:MAG: alpha-L-fucosidase, partial [Verrucomicrobiae bacterium]|nr:alpha-L-fucosidase [Verrucomicrobiae bacterium]
MSSSHLVPHTSMNTKSHLLALLLLVPLAARHAVVPDAGGQQADDIQIVRPTDAGAKAAPAAPDRLAWWSEARFGMFIHWGLFSIPAGVWEGKASRRRYAEHIMLSEKIPMAEYAKL